MFTWIINSLFKSETASCERFTVYFTPIVPGITREEEESSYTPGQLYAKYHHKYENMTCESIRETYVESENKDLYRVAVTSPIVLVMSYNDVWKPFVDTVTNKAVVIDTIMLPKDVVDIVYKHICELLKRLKNDRPYHERRLQIADEQLRRNCQILLQGRTKHEKDIIPSSVDKNHDIILDNVAATTITTTNTTTNTAANIHDGTGIQNIKIKRLQKALVYCRQSVLLEIEKTVSAEQQRRHCEQTALEETKKRKFAEQECERLRQTVSQETEKREVAEQVCIDIRKSLVHHEHIIHTLQQNGQQNRGVILGLLVIAGIIAAIFGFSSK